MIAKLLLLPFTLVKKIVDLIFGIFKLGFSAVFGVITFVFGRVFGTIFGALIGFFIGSKNIGIKMPWNRKKKSKPVNKV